MYCIVLTGPTGDRDSLCRGLVTSRRGGQPALHLGASRLKENAQLELDLQVSCAKRHRSTAQA